jgi:hypothetical protein
LDVLDSSQASLGFTSGAMFKLVVYAYDKSAVVQQNHWVTYPFCDVHLTPQFLTELLTILENHVMSQLFHTVCPHFCPNCVGCTFIIPAMLFVLICLLKMLWALLSAFFGEKLGGPTENNPKRQVFQKFFTSLSARLTNQPPVTGLNSNTPLEQTI